MTEKITQPMDRDARKAPLRQRVVKGLAATCLIAPVVPVLASCGEAAEQLPALDCTIFRTTAFEGSVEAYITPLPGTAFANAAQPASLVKDAVVTFNTVTDGEQDREHVQPYVPFRHDFPEMNGITNSIKVEVIPNDPQKYATGHCMDKFEFWGVPAES